MLLPVIHRKEFVDLPQMKRTVKEYLSDLLMLTDEEQAFLRDFSNKRYSPEKLFSDTGILDRIRSHPMVEWKIASAKKSGIDQRVSEDFIPAFGFELLSFQQVFSSCFQNLC